MNLSICQYVYGSFFDQFCLKIDQFCQNHFFKWFFVIVIGMKQVKQFVSDVMVLYQ